MCAAAPGPGRESWRGILARAGSAFLEWDLGEQRTQVRPSHPALRPPSSRLFPSARPEVACFSLGFLRLLQKSWPARKLAAGAWRGAVPCQPASLQVPGTRRLGLAARDSAPGLGARPRVGGPLRLGRLLLPMPHGGGAHPVVWLLSTPGSQGPSTRAGRPDPLRSAPAGRAVRSTSL